jgi:hypothetical protein
MNNQLFRKKSLQKVSSPEQLDAYIRVSTPGIWMLLAAIAALLVGVCVWGILGRLDTKISTVAEVRDNHIAVYVAEAHIQDVETGMVVTVDGKEFTVASIAAQPVAVDGSFSDYACHVGGLQPGQWVYALTLDGETDDGVYTAQIVTESVSPISFVIN